MRQVRIGRVRSVKLSVLNQSKIGQVGGCRPAQCFIQLSQPGVVILSEGNRREVLEGCSTDLTGMQVSPNSASDLARCVINETDLKLA